jgi:hypothetical protein
MNHGDSSRLARRMYRLGGLSSLALSLSAMTACTPEIGDDCSTSTDCSINGDRLCDTTQTGGYCTVFNCEPNGCPDDALCVAFEETSCSGAVQTSRFRRTFCMASCESDGDCRSGYRCVDTSAEPGRRVVDVNPSSLRICQIPSTTMTAPSTEEPAVCNPSDASFPEVGRPDAGGDASVDGSSSDVADARLGAEADVAVDAPDTAMDVSIDTASDVAVEGDVGADVPTVRPIEPDDSAAETAVDAPAPDGGD